MTCTGGAAFVAISVIVCSFFYKSVVRVIDVFTTYVPLMRALVALWPLR